MVYIESRAFTRRLHQLAGVAALDVLSAIQADLVKNPVETWYQGSAESVRHAARILPDIRASEADTGICSCIWRIETIFMYLLDKDEQEDLSNEERKELRTLVAEIKATR